MYLPLRLALELGREIRCARWPSSRPPGRRCTRSTGPGIRSGGGSTSVSCVIDEPDAPAIRHVYNVRLARAGSAIGHGCTEPDLIVVVDDGHAVPGPDGVAESIAAATGAPVLLAVLTPGRSMTRRDGALHCRSRWPARRSAATDPTRWPGCSPTCPRSNLEADIAERESAIQAGRGALRRIVADRVPAGPATTRRCSTRCWPETARRLAHAVGAVTELVLAERGPDIVLASLARAGTPIGILMRRWARQLHGLDLPHYAVSIVRARGIDRVALEYLAAHHDPASVVFVDGWTGKGAIAKELTAALSRGRGGRRAGVLRRSGGAGRPRPQRAHLRHPGRLPDRLGLPELDGVRPGVPDRAEPEVPAARATFTARSSIASSPASDVSGVLLDAVSAQFDGRRAPTCWPEPTRWRRRTGG